MDLTVSEYLSSKGIQVHRAAGPEVTVHCLFCTDGDTKGKGKLYVNTDTWLYDCKRCGETGNKFTLMRHFGDEPDKSSTDEQTRRTLLSEFTDLAHEYLLARTDVLEYLVDRGLDDETITSWRLGYVPMNVGISAQLPSSAHVKRLDLINAGLLLPSGQEAFSGVITMPYWSNGQVVQIRKKDIGGKYRFTVGENPRLFNADSLRGADQAIITEGEFDCMVLQQALRQDEKWDTTAVVGFPGATSFPPGWEGYFLDLRKVFIGADPDKAGDVMVRKLKAALGPRARVIELPRGEPKCDWTEYLRDRSPEHIHGGHTLTDVATLITEADLLGKRMFTMSDARVHWDRQRGRHTGIKTGWQEFDRVLTPGLQPGQVMIPLAKTGTGKTVFLSNLAHNMRDRRVLFLSLELTAAEVYEQMYRIHRFWTAHGTRWQMEGDYHQLRVVDQNRLTVEDVQALAAEYAEEVGDPPEVIMVDYLGYFARSARGASQYERLTSAAMDMKAVAKSIGAVVIAPQQVSRVVKEGEPITLDDARDSGAIEETADFLPALWRPDKNNDRTDATGGEYVPTGPLNMKLLKSRHGGAGRVFNFRFSNMSLAIAETLDRVSVERIDRENDEYTRGTSYARYRRQIDQVQGSLVP